MEHPASNSTKLLTLLILTVLFGMVCATPHAEPLPGGTLEPSAIPKYVEPLVIPSVQAPRVRNRLFTIYAIAARQFEQQVLPSGYPLTTLWGYGNAVGPQPGQSNSTFASPGLTLEARRNEHVFVDWVNGLVDQRNHYLPHLLPVDPTLYWANPPGPPDSRSTSVDLWEPYKGPVPLVTHVHGAQVSSMSDGNPEAWYLPRARNIPLGYSNKGTRYGSVFPVDRGQAIYEYDNSQRAATLWYHDDALGIARLNVYAGLAGFWLIRDDEEDSLGLPGPAPGLGDPPDKKYYEIPLMIQDRSFNLDGSLFYPDSRGFFENMEASQLQLPFVPQTAVGGASSVPPVWNPGFLGNTMVVNGRTWPYLEVEARRYRFRLLNASNARFLILKLSNPDLKFWQIGNDGGLLPKPIKLHELLLAPAERADVIIDFSGIAPQTQVTLLNIGPDKPFAGGTASTVFAVADPDTTGQIMQFKIMPSTGPDTSTSPDRLVLPAIEKLGPEDNVRQVSLNLEGSATVLSSQDPFGNSIQDPNGRLFDPTAAKLGTIDNSGNGIPKAWSDDVTETPLLNSIEVWEIYNFTKEAHPIHLHMVGFEVLNRQAFGESAQEPQPSEKGIKDTVIAYPGQITRIKARFDRAGLYAWNCNILEYQDNEMIRPFEVANDQSAFPDDADNLLQPLLQSLKWSR